MAKDNRINLFYLLKLGQYATGDDKFYDHTVGCGSKKSSKKLNYLNFAKNKQKRISKKNLTPLTWRWTQRVQEKLLLLKRLRYHPVTVFGPPLPTVTVFRATLHTVTITVIIHFSYQIRIINLNER